jgi:hypothetical protein
MKNSIKKDIYIAAAIGVLFITETTPAFAYDWNDYEEMDGRLVVDNAHETASAVNLYILSGTDADGFANYEFYQTMDENGNEDELLMLYHDRYVNLKKLTEFDDGTCIFYGKFGIENGTYCFSNNFCTSNITLTPDLEDPRSVAKVDVSSSDAYFASYTEFLTDVEDETVNVYCMFSDDTWADEHINTLIQYAQEIEGAKQSNAETATSVDKDEMDELRDIAGDNELFNDFLDSLEEETAVYDSVTETTEITEVEENKISVTENSEITEDEDNGEIEETGTIKKKIEMAVAAIFLIIGGILCIKTKTKKQS